jgi:imidazolonepropionase-like amidohydrolase
MKRRFVLIMACALIAELHVLAQGITVIEGATVIDGTGRPPVPGTTVVIEGKHIKQIGQISPTSRHVTLKGARMIDARGKYLIPGMADMHNHLGDGTFDPSAPPPDLIRNLKTLVGWGVTTIFDMGNASMDAFTDLKRVSATDDSACAHFYGVGRKFTIKNGHSASDGLTPETPEQAREMVKQLKAQSVDAIKIIDEDFGYLTKNLLPKIGNDVIAAIIDEAHRQGLKVYVHAPILAYAKEVLRMGADGLVHGIISDPVDDEFISLMKKNHAIYITTNAIFEACMDMAGWARKEQALDYEHTYGPAIFAAGLDPTNVQKWESRWNNLSYGKAHMPVLRANLKKVYDAGILVVTGSDTSNAGIGVLLGLASQTEVTMMVESGLTPMQAIQVATLNPARMLGRQRDLGSIEAGKLADLIILDADPLSDIHNISHIEKIIKGGVIYDPKQLRAGN